MINRLKDWHKSSRSLQTDEWRNRSISPYQMGRIQWLWDLNKPPNKEAKLSEVLYEKYGKKNLRELTNAEADNFISKFERDSSG